MIPELAEAAAELPLRPRAARPRRPRRAWRELCGGHGELEVTSNSPSAPVALENPHVRRLRERLELAPKQAWTPVAEFGRAGIDAINFGPGAPAQAHQRAE